MTRLGRIEVARVYEPRTSDIERGVLVLRQRSVCRLDTTHIPPCPVWISS